ncbi:MAG: carbohydrate ABC transporter permease [Treponema sp.]|jgi:multiple sugar transport system permease protein|nr:carbohydrate ABC transporter permease [Treponema sp.]
MKRLWLKQKSLFDLISIALLLAGTVVMVFPFLWMLSTSLKIRQSIFIMPPQLIPRPASFVKYLEIWKKVPLLSGFKNSLTIVVSVCLVGTFTSSLAAFAFSKIRFPHKSMLFMLLIATMMIPYAVIMIPQFVAFSTLRLVDTLWPLIFPGLLGNISMIFFLRQYMTGIPDDMLDAGRIDGCGLFAIYARLVIPNCGPALASQIILWFMGMWNDFLGPMIYLNSPEKLTVQAVLSMLNTQYTSQMDYPLIMAGSVISILPIIVVFCMFQRFFLESLAISSIKA